MIQPSNLMRMELITPASTHSHRGDGPDPRSSNPYRGWTMVERPGGVYMTKDNLRYVRVGDVGSGIVKNGSGNGLCARFHEMVDEREGSNG